MTKQNLNSDIKDSGGLLAEHRRQIDRLDDEIVGLLAKRFAVVRSVAEIKALHDLPVHIPERIEEVCARNATAAAELGVSEDLVRQLFKRIIEASCALEEQLIGKDKP